MQLATEARQILESSKSYYYLSNYNRVSRELKYVDLFNDLVMNLRRKFKESENKNSSLHLLMGIRPWNERTIPVLEYFLGLFKVHPDLLEKLGSGNWIYTNDLPKNHPLYEHLIKWNEAAGDDINYYALCDFLTSYSISGKQETIKDIIFKNLLEEEKMYQNCSRDLEEALKNLKIDLNLQRRFEKDQVDNKDLNKEPNKDLDKELDKKSKFNLPEPYRFEDLFTDRLSLMCLTSLHKAALKIPGAVDWIREHGKGDIRIDDDMVQKLSYSEEVKECTHTGMSIHWSFSTLSDAYRNWKYFATAAFVARGIRSQSDQETARNSLNKDHE